MGSGACNGIDGQLESWTSVRQSRVYSVTGKAGSGEDVGQRTVTIIRTGEEEVW